MDYNRKAKIFADDTVVNSNGNLAGIVTRTWHDEQPEFSEALAPGEFMVYWLHDFGPYGQSEVGSEDVTVVHEDGDNYTLVDRSFVLGDVVKLDSSSPMSGIVEGGQTDLTIRNLGTGEITSCSGTQVTVEAEEFQPGDYVVANSWIGIINKIDRKSLVKFCDGQMALCDEAELAALGINPDSIFYPSFLPCTQYVQASKRELRKAEYFVGQHVKTMDTTGVVVHTKVDKVYVNWQFQNMMVPSFSPLPQPPACIKIGNEGAIDIRTSKLLDGVFSHQIGDIVKLKSRPGPFYRPPYTEFKHSNYDTLKDQCHEWSVRMTGQRLKVRWQDGSHSEHTATNLVPYLNVDDLDTWPADHVLSKAGGKSGVVQSCNAEERLATVKWTENDTIEEVSLYDITTDESYNLDLGDLVLILPEDGKVDASVEAPSSIMTSIRSIINRYVGSSIPETNAQTSSAFCVDWFGQLIAIETDGTCTVSLAYERPPRDIRVPISRLIHVAGGDQDDEGSVSTDESDLDIDSTDPESDAYDSDSSAPETNIPWIVDATMETVDDPNNSDWSDEQDSQMGSDEEAQDIIDVLAEEIVEPNTVDIVLDLPAESITGQDDVRSAESTSQPLEHKEHKRRSIPEDGNTCPAQENVSTNPEIPEKSSNIVPLSGLDLAGDAFRPVLVLDIEPLGHTFVSEAPNRRPAAMRRIAHEIRTLRDALPSGICVRTYETRLDLLRVLILGPLDTPYEYAPLLFDFYLPPEFPDVPPIAHFHSWTNGIGKCNPNLYEDGKVCLSLLGTWHASSESETWSDRSSLLQLFVSLQALVLVKDPFYNEAGYDILSAQDTAVAAANYSERAYVLTRGFVAHALQNPIPGLSQELDWLYHGEPGYLETVIARSDMVIQRSLGNQNQLYTSNSSVTKVSKGALVILQRFLSALINLRVKSRSAAQPEAK